MPVTQKQLNYIVCCNCKRVFIFEADVQDHKDQTGHQEFYTLDFDYVLNSEAAEYVRVVLHHAIIAGLRSLGERAMNSVVWHLSNNHVFIDSGTLDVKKFYQCLQDIIGPSADSVLESATKHLLLHYKVIKGRDLSREVDSLASRSPDERLLYLMKTILNLQEWR